MFEAETDRAIDDPIDLVGAVDGLRQTPAKLAALVSVQHQVARSTLASCGL